MTSILFLLFCITQCLAHGFYNITQRANPPCDDECLSYTDVKNVPHEVKGRCCPLREVTSFGSCALDPASWIEVNGVGKCASFCPVRVSYSFGREVYLPNKPPCKGECNFKDGHSDIGIFQGQSIAAQVPAGVSAPSVFERDLRQGFHDELLMTRYLKDDDIIDLVATEDYAHGDRQYAYYTFLPLYRAICGTYTESKNPVDKAKAWQCDNRRLGKEIINLENVCVSMPVLDPNDSSYGIGRPALIPVRNDCDDDGHCPVVQIDKAPAEYKGKGTPILGQVALKYGKYLFSGVNPSKKGFGTHCPNQDDARWKNAPRLEDCRKAAERFYSVMWDPAYPELTVDTTKWKNCQKGDELCIDTYQYGTCKFQLGFAAMNQQPALARWGEHCQGGGLGTDGAGDVFWFHAAIAQILSCRKGDLTLGDISLQDYTNCAVSLYVAKV